MNKKSLNVGFISDIHLFHPRTSTREIVRELKLAFPITDTSLDILYLGGDVFDRIGSLPNQDVADANDFIYYILKWGKITNTQLRILEGTPSHDWRQSALFMSMNDKFDIGCDVKYFQDLSIEYDETFDIYVLYAPDEWERDTNETFKQVQTLLKKKGIEKVDLAIMHGQFTYQLPEIAKAPKHLESNYLSIVKYYISIGHVHVHSHFERILAQGSFSRLAHGEEEDKGYIRATLYKDGNMEWRFIVNNEAPKYITIDISGKSPDNAMKLIKRMSKGFKMDTRIRLLGEKNNPLINELGTVSRAYPEFRFTKKTLEEQQAEIEKIDEDLDYQKPTQITPDNIITIMCNRLLTKYPNEPYNEECKTILNEVI